MSSAATKQREVARDAKLKAPLSWRFSRHRRLYKAISNIEQFFEYGPKGIPEVTGPADLHDVLMPGTNAAAIPYYYMAKPVHRMGPLGYLDPKQPARNNRVIKAIPYIRNDRIAPWLEANIRTRIEPTRIMEVASGQGRTALVYAELFPSAEVIGIDLAAPGLRAGMQSAADQGLTNIRFYQMDSGDMSAFDDESFDVVHLAHALHEMPEDHIEKTVRESIRITRTGGLLPVFDWRIPQTEQEWEHRRAMVRVGQEPYMLHYSRANFPAIMEALGCTVEAIGQESNSCTWLVTKGPDANRLLQEVPVAFPSSTL